MVDYLIQFLQRFSSKKYVTVDHDTFMMSSSFNEPPSLYIPDSILEAMEAGESTNVLSGGQAFILAAFMRGQQDTEFVRESIKWLSEAGFGQVNETP